VATSMTQPSVSHLHVSNHLAIPAEPVNKPISHPSIRETAAIIRNYSKWPLKNKKLLQLITHIVNPIDQKVVNNSQNNPQKLKSAGLLNSAKEMIVKDHFKISVKHAKII